MYKKSRAASVLAVYASAQTSRDPNKLLNLLGGPNPYETCPVVICYFLTFLLRFSFLPHVYIKFYGCGSGESDEALYFSRVLMLSYF
jgi:hypothetical protein